MPDTDTDLTAAALDALVEAELRHWAVDATPCRPPGRDRQPPHVAASAHDVGRAGREEDQGDEAMTDIAGMSDDDLKNRLRAVWVEAPGGQMWITLARYVRTLVPPALTTLDGLDAKKIRETKP